MATYLHAGGRVRLVPAPVRAREDEKDEHGVALIDRWVLDPDGVGARVVAEYQAAEEKARAERGEKPPETHEDLQKRLSTEATDLHASIEAANAAEAEAEAAAKAATVPPPATPARPAHRSPKKAEE